MMKRVIGGRVTSPTTAASTAASPGCHLDRCAGSSSPVLEYPSFAPRFGQRGSLNNSADNAFHPGDAAVDAAVVGEVTRAQGG
jgi:hypothetical protein